MTRIPSPLIVSRHFGLSAVKSSVIPDVVAQGEWLQHTPAGYNGTTRENRAIVDFSFYLEQCT